MLVFTDVTCLPPRTTISCSMGAGTGAGASTISSNLGRLQRRQLGPKPPQAQSWAAHAQLT